MAIIDHSDYSPYREPAFFRTIEIEARLRDSLVLVQDKIDDADISLITTIASVSPYLFRLMERHKEFFGKILVEPRDVIIHEIYTLCDLAIEVDDQNQKFPQQKIILRKAKDYAALAFGYYELSGQLSVMDAAYEISLVADKAVQAAFQISLNEAHNKGYFDESVIFDVDACGISVLAMGKLGAQELNYSSDIDLTVFYDPDKMPVNDGQECKIVAVRIVKDMVNILSEQTAHGYVFRTDLRLRPDPGVTSIAISVGAAEHYYEAHGQNWERAAYIKARPIAGDENVGIEFIKMLRPFIWRKYMDFSAIDSLNAILNRLKTSNHVTAESFSGFNIKTGSNAIRTIEFIVQTYQLIAGGKFPALRCRGTLEGLSLLANHNYISQKASQHLARAYCDMRYIEQRLQMINDEQTHIIPRNQNGREQLRILCGFSDHQSLEDFVINAASMIAQEKEELFLLQDGGEETSSHPLKLDFTGVDHNQATIEELEKLGFVQPSDVSAIVKSWLSGSYRATRSSQARILLEKILPGLMLALSNANEPDKALHAFDYFLAKLPGGVQIFSLLSAHPKLYEKLIDMLTISPKLANMIAHRQHFVEIFADGLTSFDVRDHASIEVAIKTALLHLGEDSNFEDRIGIIHQLIGEARLSVVIEVINRGYNVFEASKRYTEIAELALESIIEQARCEMVERYGDIGGSLAVLSFGRLASKQMGYSSDLDIVFVYDVDGDRQSQGVKPIDAISWYTRFVRRIVTGLSSGSMQGGGYDIDMQLRPSGGKGPAAVQFSAFQNYYRNDAWMWELMALTKSRLVYGSEKLTKKITDEITSILCVPRKPDKVGDEVVEMRQRMFDNNPPQSIWDRKRIGGGGTDIDFLLHYLALTSADKTGRPPVSSRDQLKFYNAHGQLTEDQFKKLDNAFLLDEKVNQIARLSEGKIFNPERDGRAFITLLLNVCGMPDVAKLQKILERNDRQVQKIFSDLITL